MSAHTPGPWSADAEGCEIFSPSANGRVAMVGERSDIEVERANARLIAAAPDLLTSLEKMLEVYWQDDGETPPQFILAARAAIAKATGAA